MERTAQICGSCGHEAGAGRFCINCGQPHDVGSQAGDERPTAAGPRPPPPAHSTPRPARYPLFADEAVPGATPAYPPPVAQASPALFPPPAEPTYVVSRPPGAPERRPRAAAIWWAAAAVSLVMLLGAGGVLLLTGSDSPRDSATDVGASPSTSATDSSDGTPEEVTAPEEPSTTDDADPGAQPGNPVELATSAVARPPETAAPSRDVNGNAVRYEAFNMLDGQGDTAWRMPGDASGETIVFRLPGPTSITSVGLINGYAKVGPGYDGYAANRRITSVEWVFADGTVVAQDLTDDLALQSIPVDGAEGAKVTLRIVSVSQPASGPSGRDYTAISEISLVGAPA